MNLIDSSCWIEYFSGSQCSEAFSGVIEENKQLLVPTVVVYEVYRKILKERDESTVLFYLALMKQGKIVDLSLSLSLFAVRVQQKFHLGMADSIIYATAREHGAELWTMDSDFKGLEGVRYFGKG